MNRTETFVYARAVFGPDPKSNPRLALAVSSAKRAGFPKASIETAIARGQGTSASGAALEPLVIEAIFPPSVAAIIDCLTDSKLRTLQDVRLLIKNHEGSVTPTNYLFEKKGRVVFHKKEGIGADEALEAALEVGALDVVEDEEGKVVMFTEPSITMMAGEQLARSLTLGDPNIGYHLGSE